MRIGLARTTSRGIAAAAGGRGVRCRGYTIGIAVQEFGFAALDYGCDALEKLLLDWVGDLGGSGVQFFLYAAEKVAAETARCFGWAVAVVD